MADPTPHSLGTSTLGKELNDPSQSELYDRNGCPPVKFFKGVPWQHCDEEENLYWEVATQQAFIDWVEAGVIKTQVSHLMDSNRDSLFFVRQSAKSRKNKAVFVLAESGSLTLQSRKKKGGYMTGSVVAVGQTTSGSYADRAVRWILLRDCKSS